MSTKELNQLRRAAIAKEVQRLYALGWNYLELAALLGVSSGTIHSWARGRTMGTNVQRATLTLLYAPAHPATKAALRIRLEELDRLISRRLDLVHHATTRGETYRHQHILAGLCAAHEVLTKKTRG